MANEVFLPVRSVRIDASTASKRVAIPGEARHMRIFNNTTSMAWVTLGGNTVTSAILAADTAGEGFPIAPNSVELFRCDPRNANTHVAVALLTGTGIVNVTVGEGW